MSDDAKSKFDDGAKSQAIESLTILLSCQLAFFPKAEPSGTTPIEISQGNINKKAIGYIYGFIDSALQNRGLDITDLDVGMPVIYHVLRHLFPGHQQSYVDFLMNHMDDEIVILGMMEGGQQYIEFLRDKNSPWGLTKFIYEGQNKRD